MRPCSLTGLSAAVQAQADLWRGHQMWLPRGFKETEGERCSSVELLGVWLEAGSPWTLDLSLICVTLCLCEENLLAGFIFNFDLLNL